MDEAQARLVLADFEKHLLKDLVRFAVGRERHGFSGGWAFRGQKNEFYIAARSIFGSTKISLHGSNVCRLALTCQHIKLMAAQGLPLPVDRALVKWRRPEAPALGAHLAVVLVFPTDFLRNKCPECTQKKPMVVLEPAAPRKAVEIGFFFTREERGSIELKFLDIGKPVFWHQLDHGEFVWMVAREADFDPKVLPSSELLSATGQILDKTAFPEIGAERENLTAILWNSPKDGEALRMIEIGGVKATRNR